MPARPPPRVPCLFTNGRIHCTGTSTSATGEMTMCGCSETLPTVAPCLVSRALQSLTHHRHRLRARQVGCASSHKCRYLPLFVVVSGDQGARIVSIAHRSTHCLMLLIVASFSCATVSLQPSPSAWRVSLHSYKTWCSVSQSVHIR